jgi:hypothetical protein
MEHQSPKSHRKKTVKGDIDNSLALASNSKSIAELGGDIICRTDTSPARYILARKVPFFTQNVHTSSDHQPLQHHIWCLIKTERGEYRYELLSECQRNRKAGKFRYHDVDWGKGLHPHADQVWLATLRAKGKWSTSVYDVKATVRLRAKGHSTVILSAEGYGSDLLKRIRKDCNYVSNELVRLPSSMFKKARNG